MCLLTFVSEGGGGRGRGNRGSRSRDGTLANRLLHDAPPLHLVHHIFCRDVETRGGERVRRWRVRKDERHERGEMKKYVGEKGKKEEKETQAGRRVWRRM